MIKRVERIVYWIVVFQEGFYQGSYKRYSPYDWRKNTNNERVPQPKYLEEDFQNFIRVHEFFCDCGVCNFCDGTEDVHGCRGVCQYI